MPISHLNAGYDGGDRRIHDWTYAVNDRKLFMKISVCTRLPSIGPYCWLDHVREEGQRRELTLYSHNKNLVGGLQL